ncbi:MAG TPA: hypothetical protein VFU69_06800 [Ktedonobacterales bacterium]|nr:hypothetical protein [Ktedonobacterales bacterium]
MYTDCTATTADQTSLILFALAGLDLFVLMIPSVLLALVAARAAQSNEPVAAG